MESTMLNKQVEKLERELHQMNIYLKDIAQSLKVIANPDLREETWHIDNRPCSLYADKPMYNNTREELSDDDLK